MKKFLFVSMLLMSCFAVQSAIQEVPRREKVRILTTQAQSILEDMQTIIDLHEQGFARKFRFVDDDSLTVGRELTSQEKQRLRNKFKSNADSVIVKMNELKDLIP